MCPANERWRYNVTSSLIGCAHTQNSPWYEELIVSKGVLVPKSEKTKLSYTYESPTLHLLFSNSEHYHTEMIFILKDPLVPKLNFLYDHIFFSGLHLVYQINGFRQDCGASTPNILELPQFFC